MSDSDPYAVLGVERTANQDAIRRAYRAIAKKHHPDLNPDDPEAERLFKQAAAAYDIVGDAEKRARYDRGEIDASGQERPEPPPSSGFGRSDFMAQEGFADPADLEAFLNEMFGGAGARTRRRPMRGADVFLVVSIPFRLACTGGTRKVSMPNRPAFDLRIPPAVDDGDLIRAPGLGEPGYDGAPPGDALVEIHVEPHPYFTRKDADILLDLPITIAEAVVGGVARAPTVHGPVDLKIPANAEAGRRLRLKGKGLADGRGGFGDQYVRLVIVPPDRPDPELADCLTKWAARAKQNPRAKLEDRS